jgi:DNA-binding response OmpR family regulator
MNTDQGYLLIVEDDLDIQSLLETSLTLKEYRVISTQDGREALEAVQKEHPLIVIADIMMPHLDGYGLAHRLRIDPETHNIPIVFITATYVAPEDREFAFDIGVAEIIQKPVNIATFLETIERLLTEKPRAALDPLAEFKFYDGYRKRLEDRLEQKVKQIARDEHLLEDFANTEGHNLRASLHQAVRERDELKLLLDKIDKQLERIGRIK